MPEVTPRMVEQHDVERALQLIDSAGLLITRAQGTNVYTLQLACSTLAEDMVAYAKELLKTPVPPEPEALAAEPAQ